MAKVNVRMLVGMAGPRIVCQPGRIYPFEKSEALRLVEHGAGVIVEPIKGGKPSLRKEERALAGKAAAP